MNTQVKHTPGPWKRTTLKDGTRIIAGTHKPNFHIAKVFGPSQVNPITGESIYPVPDANANLIAAAPAMYEALSDVPLPSCNGDKAEWYARFYVWYCGARQAAIAQAEGSTDHERN